MERPKMPALPIFVLGSLLVLGTTQTRADSDPGAKDLLPNPSFEQPDGSRPAGWETFTWRGEGTFEYARTGRTGGRSVMIASEAGADVGWVVKVPVEPFSSYRLSGWIKTEDVQPSTGRGALFNLHNIQPVATDSVRGTRDWTAVDVIFETGDQDYVQVNCLFGGWGLAAGKAWYDDVKLERLSTTTLKPTITIDTRKTGQPISKYIYGQFIEHLGRCIYGGIWAEMLEDRKFFDPVGAGESPWKAIGGTGAVKMVREGCFVGEQTPEVAPPGDGSTAGIVQGGLGLVQGASYVGRIWLAGSPQAGPVAVSLVWGDGPGDRQTVPVDNVAPEYAKTALRFTAGKSTDDGRLEIVGSGRASFRVGTVSLMPADNVDGMRADTLRLLNELDSPVYRWPGGNFVSGYNWRDGIGDPDRRPPRKNPAWKGIEHNDFGLDEFMVFCRALDTEPLVVVNSGLGDVKMAVAELQYANGGAETPMGRLRAQNGHADPYGVKWWGIGNEMYGGWQLGHMPLEQYLDKNNQFADALRAEDPSIRLIAVGAVGPWSEGMMRHCADHMDLISEHFYVQNPPGLIAHVRQMTDRVRGKAEAHRRYRREFESLKGKDIRIALDEWNYWYGPHVYGELGVRYFLKDALGVAAALHEFARNTDMYFMANYAQTVNVIGAIKTSKTAACFATTGLALMLYRKHFGVLPVTVQAGQPLDVMAAWSQDRKRLTVGIVNPTLETFDVPLEVLGAKLTGTGRLFRIAGSDPMAYNEPGRKPNVAIDESAVSRVVDKLKIVPCSVALYVLDAD
jgi:alpha-N-arabinofuranosidase